LDNVYPIVDVGQLLNVLPIADHFRQGYCAYAHAYGASKGQALESTDKISAFLVNVGRIVERRGTPARCQLLIKIDAPGVF